MAVKTFTTGEVLTSADTNTYLANSGLVFVKQQAFTGSGTAEFTSCFNANYDNYRLVFVCTSSPASGQIINGQMLLGTTPATTAVYSYYEAGNTWAGAADVGGSGAGGAWFAMRSNAFFMGTFEIQSPFLAQYSTFQSEGVDSTQSWESRGYHAANTSYDGIKFFCTAGNISMTVASYGYRKQ